MTKKTTLPMQPAPKCDWCGAKLHKKMVIHETFDLRRPGPGGIATGEVAGTRVFSYCGTECKTEAVDHRTRNRTLGVYMRADPETKRHMVVKGFDAFFL